MSKSRDNLFESLLADCESDLQRWIILSQRNMVIRAEREKRDARKASEMPAEQRTVSRDNGQEDTANV